MFLAAAPAVVPAITQAAHVEPPPVPSNLEVPEGNRAFLMAHAVGTQNYICLGAGQSCTFIGPQATLFNADLDQTFTHFLSPNPVEAGVARATWQFKDASAVWAWRSSRPPTPAFVTPRRDPLAASCGPWGPRPVRTAATGWSR